MEGRIMQERILSTALAGTFLLSAALAGDAPPPAAPAAPAAAPTAAGTAQGLKPGDPAPAFTLPGSDGKTYNLADFKGKKTVVLAWFPKAFTGG
jgi:cytochrome oxidase Cu insertion factor (SCO1/SenC/PrrC family)